MYFKYATIVIPARTALKRTADHSPTSFGWDLRVRAKIPAYKDGRTRGTKAYWVFNNNGYGYYLEQSQESAVTLSDVEVKKVNI